MQAAVSQGDIRRNKAEWQCSVRSRLSLWPFWTSPQLAIETGSVPCKHERTCEHRCHSLSASRSGSAEQLPEVPACREPGAVIPPSRVRKGGAQSGSRFCWEGKLELTEALRRESQPREFQKGSAQENPEGRFGGEGARTSAAWSYAPWHFLYFFPLPQGQGSLRPTLSSLRWTVWVATGSSPRLSVSFGCGRDMTGGGGAASSPSFRTA